MDVVTQPPTRKVVPFPAAPKSNFRADLINMRRRRGSAASREVILRNEHSPLYHDTQRPIRMERALTVE